MKVMFMPKSSKTASPVQEHVAKEITEEEFFGCNLETVEKENNVPKIVVECVQILEDTSNLTTPGIYRVSGKKFFIVKHFVKRHF